MTRALLLSAAILVGSLSGTAQAARPSAIAATGVISAKYGIDRSNWDWPPYLCFSFTQTEKIFPTTIIERKGPVAKLQHVQKPLDFTRLAVTDPATEKSMSLDELLEQRLFNHGIIVLHKGQVVHESYRGGLTRDERHITMSASKSFIGMLTAIAIAQGRLNENDLVTKYVPQLVGKSVWKDVTVRHVWDMRDGTQFDENYGDERSDAAVCDRATGWRPRTNQDPRGMRDFVSKKLNERSAPLGQIFHYSSVRTEVLAMAIEGATGKTIDEVFEQEFWQRLGAEHDASFAGDGFGHHLSHGGISMTLPDFARAANLVLHQGRNAFGEQVVPQSFFEDVVAPRPELKKAFMSFGWLFPEGQYRSHFWVRDPRKRQIAMLGAYGQTAYFDFDREMAVVTFGAYPTALDAIMFDSLKLAWDEIAESLSPARTAAVSP